MLKFIQREMDPKHGMKAFKEYAAWKVEAEKTRKSNNQGEFHENHRKPPVSKKVLVQYRFDNTGDKIPLLNTYLCWLLLWCGTLAY
jgi:hypothetical protein